ncbi:MAG: TetR/AcrR family transcriptional regulator [Lachnospiraceae bacterium]|nr:TetR/AcrR family transcriptional regulator [Lachnospiraceae bacterium]MDD3659700.1 TetR/AcrR family transcriptional regulator [Lachnospiraceae bacterium]
MNDRFFEQSKDKQDRIMNAALKVFSKSNYKHASTDVIIKEADISKGLLFHYFTNKAGLYSFLYAYCVRYIQMERAQILQNPEEDFFKRMIQVEQAYQKASKKYPYIELFLTQAELEEEEEILLLIQEKKKEFTNETNHILLGTVTESEISDRNEMMKQSLLQYTMAGIRNRYADANGFDPDAMFEEMKEHILFLNQLFCYTRSEKGESI